jgi:hypothetical protein
VIANVETYNHKSTRRGLVFVVAGATGEEGEQLFQEDLD